MPWQPATLVYPDAELLVTTRLRALLTPADEVGVFVGNKVPNPRRPRMVIVTRDGGNVADLTDRPRLRIRVWDTTAQKATDLARVVAGLMPLMVDGAPVVRVEHLSGPIEVPDVQEQRYLLFEIRTQGVPL